MPWNSWKPVPRDPRSTTATLCTTFRRLVRPTGLWGHRKSRRGSPSWTPSIRTCGRGWAGRGDSGQVALGLEISAALWRFWLRRGHLSEGRRWLGLLLGAPGAELAPLDVWAEALTGAAWLASGQDDFGPAEALFEQALPLYHTLGQRGRVAGVTGYRALMARDRGRYDDALALAEEALELARKSEDLAVMASATFRLGLVRQERGELEEAETAYAEALERRRALGDREGAAYALLALGAVSRKRRHRHAGGLLLAEPGHEPGDGEYLGDRLFAQQPRPVCCGTG